MTPMIDIVFLLIIFFMVSSTLVKTRGIKVKVPKSVNADAESQDLIIISIKKNGTIYLNDKRTTIAKLGRELKKATIALKQDVVIIKGDKSIPYLDMIRVIDAAKMAGVEKISLATARKK